MNSVYVLWGSVLCTAVSAALITRLWTIHPDVNVWRKVFWTAVLLVPIVGWIFYGGFFAPPKASADNPSTENWWGPP